MPFKPGNKLGGRKRGSVGKKTLAIREAIEKSLGKSLTESILDDLEQMEPKERALLKLELMPYVYPKLAPQEVSDESEDSDDTEIKKLYAEIKLLEDK